MSLKKCVPIFSVDKLYIITIIILLLKEFLLLPNSLLNKIIKYNMVVIKIANYLTQNESLSKDVFNEINTNCEDMP